MDKFVHQGYITKGRGALDGRFLRNEMLIGKSGIKTLENAKVILFGVGGVGSACAESLARAGVGSVTLVDSDDVDITNINRQLHAVTETVGKRKTEVMRERILSINPDCRVEEKTLFYLPETADEIDLSGYDYIIDAIDTVSAKIELAVRAERLHIPIISCMGTGNKLKAEMLTVTDIYKTKVCPLCRVMRKELKERGIKKLKVIYSEEEPIPPQFDIKTEGRRKTPASMPFVPPVAGFLMAQTVVCDLLYKNGGRK